MKREIRAECRFSAWFPSPEHIAKFPKGAAPLVAYEFSETGDWLWAIDTQGNLWCRDGTSPFRWSRAEQFDGK